MSVTTLSLRAAAVVGVGVLAVGVGGLGTAVAVNGGSFTLGHVNTATKTTSLTDSHGIPLALKAGKGKPPLSENSSAEVKRLNAALLDGQSPASLRTVGSGIGTAASSSSGADISLPSSSGYSGPGGLVARTGTLPTGMYAVSAAAYVRTNSHDSFCYLAIGGPNGQRLQYDGGDTDLLSVSMVMPVRLTSAGNVGEYCFSVGNADAVAFNAGVTAIRLSTFVAGTVGGQAAATRHHS